jgi:PAS domain S-box-containing protein
MRFKMNLNTKMLVYILTTSVIIFGASIAFVSINSKNMALKDAIKIADSYAREYANLTKADLSVDMNITRALAQSFMSYRDIPYDLRTDIYNNIMHKIAEENPSFLSVWANWELQFRDTNWTKNHGRARFTIFRDQNNLVQYYTDTLDLEGDNKESAYYAMKVSKEETVMNPYFFSYTKQKGDEILETSVCSPILIDGEFAGLAGIDLSLDRFTELVSSIKPFDGSFALLIANNGAIVSHPDETNKGLLITEVYEDEAKEFQLLEKIQNGEQFSYFKTDKETEEEFYVSYAPIVIGKSTTPWTLAIYSPVDVIILKAMRNFRFAILVGFIGLLILTSVILFIARNISLPLAKTTKVLKELAKGNIDEKLKIHVDTNDEISDMAESVNTVIDGLNTTAAFASEIGNGNLNAEFKLLSDQDVLGNSLIDMRQSLKSAEEEENKRKVEDDKQNWTTQGIAKFAEIQRNYNNDLNELSFQLVSNLINYINANQGAIYVLDDTDNESIYYKLTSAVAFGRKKLLNDKYKPGESLVGRCAHEKKTINLYEVPEDYVNITSGLGKANPKCMLLVPLMLNDVVFGIIELASFNDFEEYQILFLEKLGESIASTISNVKINEKTAKLLEQAQQQGEELAAQEEEMRQNLEELQATQEESSRREMETAGIINALNNATYVMEYDMDGNITSVNDVFIEIYGIPRDKMIGHRYSDFMVTDEYDITEFSEFWSELKFGKTIKQTEKIRSHGKIHWVSATYTPIMDAEGNPYKVMNISINITENKNQEEEVRRLLEDSENKSKQLEEQEGIMMKNMEEFSSEFENIEKELSGQIEAANAEIERLKAELGK